MIWLRALFTALVVLIVTGPGFAPSSHAKDQQSRAVEFHGIRLGMSEAEAFAHIDRIAPGAFAGPLCTGNTGVGSYLEYRGLDWQIMAHILEGRVHQIKLFRFDSAGTATTAECQARFDELANEQKVSYPNLNWSQMNNSGGRFSLRARSYATLPDATSIELKVERLDWQKARCSIEMLISHAQLQ